MTKSRLEAFSDGVLAIIITIMVLELKVPHDSSLESLFPLLPVFVSYLFSFLFVAIYWGNHHHLLHTVHHVNSRIIWANMGLLFCLSLLPFTTGWMGENDFADTPLALYSVNLLLCAIAFYILQSAILSHFNESTALIEAIRKQEKKGYLSLALYTAAIASAFFYPLISGLCIVTTVVLWIVPDKNIEKALEKEHMRKSDSRPGNI